jgi:hypothetical protein
MDSTTIRLICAVLAILFLGVLVLHRRSKGNE